MTPELQQILQSLNALAEELNGAGVTAGTLQGNMESEFNNNPPPPPLQAPVQNMINQVGNVSQACGNLRDQVNGIYQQIDYMLQQSQ